MNSKQFASFLLISHIVQPYFCPQIHGGPPTDQVDAAGYNQTIDDASEPTPEPEEHDHDDYSNRQLVVYDPTKIALEPYTKQPLPGGDPDLAQLEMAAGCCTNIDGIFAVAGGYLAYKLLIAPYWRAACINKILKKYGSFLDRLPKELQQVCYAAYEQDIGKLDTLLEGATELALEKQYRWFGSAVKEIYSGNYW